MAKILDLWLGPEGIRFFKEQDLKEVIKKHIEATCKLTGEKPLNGDKMILGRQFCMVSSFLHMHGSTHFVSDISKIKSQLKLSPCYNQAVEKVNGMEGFHIITFLDYLPDR